MKRFLFLLISVFTACGLFAENEDSRSAEPSTFLKEGRTYWYQYSHPYGAIDVEFGLRIGEKKNIGSQEWHSVDLVKRVQRDYNTKEVKEYSENTLPVAFIREENGNIYRTLANTDFYSGTLPNLWQQVIYGFYNPDGFDLPDNPIYGFGPEGFQTKVEWALTSSSLGCDATVTDVETIENSGRSYKKYTLSFTPNPEESEKWEAVVIESIGAFGPYKSTPDFPASPGNGELIYHPFTPVMPGVDYNPKLRYVTEGEDNNVIFQKDGGFKLWEYVNGAQGIESLESDATTALRWFNLQGIEIAAPNTPGIYIRKLGSKAEKIQF